MSMSMLLFTAVGLIVRNIKANMFRSFVYRRACISHDLAVNTKGGVINCCLKYSIYHLGATVELIIAVFL